MSVGVFNLYKDEIIHKILRFVYFFSVVWFDVSDCCDVTLL
jgi:hypothetical protein